MCVLSLCQQSNVSVRAVIRRGRVRHAVFPPGKRSRGRAADGHGLGVAFGDGDEKSVDGVLPGVEDVAVVACVVEHVVEAALEPADQAEEAALQMIEAGASRIGASNLK